MKRLFYAACGLLFLGACASLIQPDVDVANAGGEFNADGVFVAYCNGEAAPVIFTKEGFPIIDDQACIPEPEVLGITITKADKSCPEGKLLVGNVCLPHKSGSGSGSGPGPGSPTTCDEFGTWPNCEDEATCFSWQTYDEDTNTCEGTSNEDNCLDWQTYVPSTNTCEGESSEGNCYNWQTFDEDTNTCEGASNEDNCFDWQTYVPSTNTCEGASNEDSCYDWQTYDENTNTCEGASNEDSCYSYQTYVPETNTCEGEPTTPADTCSSIGGTLSGGPGGDKHCQGPIAWDAPLEGPNQCPEFWEYQSTSVCRQIVPST